MNYKLIPFPNKIKPLAGVFKIPASLIEVIENYTLSSSLESDVESVSNSSFSREEYSVEIRSNGIKIESGGVAGTFYAIQTLKQIFRQSSEGLLQCLIIKDKPCFKTRSVMLDISRNKVPTMVTLFKLIDLWAELKFNQVQLYTEHTFAYKKHKKVWENYSPLTAGEISILDRYCRERAIDLVPNQNSFGHMERWLRFDEYKDLAESPEGYTDPSGVFFKNSSTLDPSSSKVFDFLKELYDELLPSFSSSYFNIGGDETYDLCQGKSKVRCMQEGQGRVYLDFIKKLHREVSSRGLRMQVYGDIIVKYPQLIPELPKDIIALDWGYEADHPFEKETASFRNAGIEYYVCAGTSSWNSIAGRWDNALDNIRSAAYWGEKNKASGFMVTEWGDNGYWQQYPTALPGYFAGASSAWSGYKGTELDFQELLDIHYFKDESGMKAKALLQMANIYKEYSSGVHNGSIFALTMLDSHYPGYRSYFQPLRGLDFSGALKELKGAENYIQKANNADKELLFTAHLLRHGIQLTIELFKTESLAIKDIPVKKRKEFSEDLKSIISEFKRLWLVRYRDGGLQDSLNIFYELDAFYSN